MTKINTQKSNQKYNKNQKLTNGDQKTNNNNGYSSHQFYKNMPASFH